METVPVMSLWLPILLSAAATFVLSTLIWMVLRWHNADWGTLDDEEPLREALRGTAPGQYAMPHAITPADRASAEWRARCQEGPVAMVTVFPNGVPALGRQFAAWFVYCLIISFFVAYVAAAALPPGADYLKVFRIAGVAAILAYAGASARGSIWFGHAWPRTIKEINDGFIYGLTTAGIFGWLWPSTGAPGFA